MKKLKPLVNFSAPEFTRHQARSPRVRAGGYVMKLISLIVSSFAICHSSFTAQPNILVIFADDLGCQGSPDVRTPHIDSLAANGVRCTAGYVTAPQCSPSRAGLMSGRYQQRFGHEGNPNFPLMLMRGHKTIADHLQAAGYATGHFGKWHLGFSDFGTAPKEIVASKDQMPPTQHGFDESFGYNDYEAVAKKGSDIAPAPHAHDDRVFARKTVDFITRHADKPWFVYLALHAPHTQQVDFGGYRARFPDAPKERLSVLAVMAQQDEAVGAVLAKLRELKQEENTLIFYLSDNGGTRAAEGEKKHFTGSLNTPFTAEKGTAYEGGIRIPFLVQWKGTLPAGNVYARPIISLDVLPTALAAAAAKPLADIALDGVNLLPFLKGEQSDDPHAALFWRWRAEQAVRQGDWKLVRGKEHRDWRLIDLSKDIKEATDLTAQHPDKAKELLALHEQWAAQMPPVGPIFKDPTEGDDEAATKPAKPETAKAEAPLAPAVLARADKNHDGKLSLTEHRPLDVQARHHGEEHFTAGDANKDGFLDATELGETLKKQTWFAILSEGVAPCFTRLDTNRDGKLDAAEYRKVSRMGGHAEQHFAAADKDKDGFLDRTEFTTHAEQILKSLESTPPTSKPK